MKNKTKLEKSGADGAIAPSAPEKLYSLVENARAHMRAHAHARESGITGDVGAVFEVT